MTLLSFTCRAQSLQGIVTDVGTGKPLYPVTIVNVFTQQSTYTDETGRYSIPALPGQRIVYSYIGYKTENRTKPYGEIITNASIPMSPTDYQLQEFKLRPGHLSQYQMDSAERKTTYKLYLQRTHPSPLRSPVSAVAEKLSRRAKRTYRFQKNFANSEMERFIDTRYNGDIVTELTGLTGDSIGHFMYAHPLPYDFARAASDLEIKMWIRTSYKAWLKNQPIDSSLKR